jgi:hypothetical protein
MMPVDARHFADSRKAWIVAVLALTAISLGPIWLFQFPAMQDYPQHLAQSNILMSKDSPGLDYRDNFECRFKVAPYMTFYLVTAGFSYFLPVEIAGRIAVSLYVLGIALLVLGLGSRSKEEGPKWGLLVFFPFLFNQNYFLGVTNYLYSLFLLFFALLDHQKFCESHLGIWSICRQLLWQLLLFLTHPFTYLVFAFLAAVQSFFYLWERSQVQRGLFSSAPGALVVILWYFAANFDKGGSTASPVWLNPITSFEYYLLMFSGMRWLGGVDKLVAALWAAMVLLMISAFFVQDSRTDKSFRRYLLYFGLATVSVLALPFRIGNYTFINLRIAAISYFFLGLICGQIRLKGISSISCVVLVVALLSFSVQKQWRISEEIKEIEPIVKLIPKNSPVLPLVFDRSSPELDRRYFDMHLHDYIYYHLIVGGGVTPYFFKQDMTPVHYLPGREPPAPGEYDPYHFLWEKYSTAYRYFIVRSAPKAFIQYIQNFTDVIGHSGKWLLLEKR